MEHIIQHIQKSDSTEVAERVFDKGAETTHLFVHSNDSTNGFESLLNHVTSLSDTVTTQTCESVLIQHRDGKVCVHYFRDKSELAEAHDQFIQTNYLKNCPTII